jgi:hypothetical protein
LDKIQFVIPIQDRYAIGVSLKLVNNHNSYFKTDSSTFDFQGKNLITNKEFRSGGGLLAGSFGVSFPMNEKMGLGFSVDRLFGSSRDEHSLVLNDIHYRMFNIRTLCLTVMNLNFAGNFYNDNDLIVLAFARISMTGKPVSGTLYQFDLFEDAELKGYSRYSRSKDWLKENEVLFGKAQWFMMDADIKNRGYVKAEGECYKWVSERLDKEKGW